MTAPVIFVDDDPDLRRATTQLLKLAGFAVQAFDGAEAALAAIDAGFEGAVVTDSGCRGWTGWSCSAG